VDGPPGRDVPSNAMPPHADKQRDREMLEAFVAVYCRKQHARDELCDDCRDLLAYALERLAKCPFDPKPKCRDCAVHCYAPAYRARIREVMRTAGMHFVKRGRVDWLLKYFLR
jgi:hypothetical protein